MEEDPVHDEPEESPVKRFLKRTYIVIIALFLILLLIVNTNTGYHLISLFSGKIVSSTLQEDYSFDLRYGGKVFFEKNIYDVLRDIYIRNQKTEFKVCLTGDKEDNNYLITGLYTPKIYAQDVFSVTSQICNNSTIISLHSHPPLRCIFSEQDITSYNRFKQINSDGMIGLMCGEERLSFFGYDS